MLLFVVPAIWALQGQGHNSYAGDERKEPFMEQPVHGEPFMCTQGTMCTTGLIRLHANCKVLKTLLVSKLYAGSSSLMWLKSSSYLKVGLCEKGKGAWLGCLVGSLSQLTYKTYFPLQHQPQHFWATLSQLVLIFPLASASPNCKEKVFISLFKYSRLKAQRSSLGLCSDVVETNWWHVFVF